MNQSISVKLHWEQQKDENFLNGDYSRVHFWELEQGQKMAASASPHIVPIPLSNPKLIDPEEAFICSVSSCHMLFFLSIASKRKIEVLSYQDNPVGTLTKNEQNQTAFSNITLHPKITTVNEVSKEQINKIHQQAHKNCFIANSIKAKIDIKL